MGKILVKIGNRECAIDNFLIQKLDNVKKIIKRNWDCVILIDGMERSGKSTLGLTCAWYISEGELTLNNVASDSDDAIRKLEGLPDRSVIMIDEGSLIFSSRESMSAEQKKLIKIMNVIGQKNMVFIIVLPSFFDLNKFIAVNRSRFLLHVYTNRHLDRGRFCFFSEHKKKVLYEYGKKHFNSYKFPKASFVGSFGQFFPFDNEQDYKDIKKKSLFDAFHKNEIAVKELKKEFIMKFYNNLLEECKKRNITLPKEAIYSIFDTNNKSFDRMVKEQAQQTSVINK